MSFHDETVTEEMIVKAERLFGVDKVFMANMECYTKNKSFGDNKYELVIMKVSSPHMEYDIYFADVMETFMKVNRIQFEREDRVITIPTGDFVKLFGGN